MYLRHPRLAVVCFAIAVVAGSSRPAVAEVMCRKRSGVVVVRTACKHHETQLDPVALGLQGPKGDPGTQGPPGPPGSQTLFGTNTGQAVAGNGQTCTLGEVILSAGSVANGTPASGQLLLISQNAALFSLLGTQYGGNGVTTFALLTCGRRRPMASRIRSVTWEYIQAGVEVCG
jgi:hypothetical protein